MSVVPTVLQGRAGQDRSVAQQFGVHPVLPVGKGVDDDQMMVGIGVVDVLGHGPLLFGRLRVLLAQVPVQRELVAEAGDQLAAIQLPFDAQVAAVQRRRRRGPGLRPCRARCGCRRFRSPAA